MPGQERLVARIERFGSERPRMLLDGLHNLAAYLLALDQDERALTIARRAAEIAVARMPVGDRTRLTAQTTLASTLLDFDRVKEALPILEQVRAAVDPEEAADPEQLPANVAMVHIGLARAKRKSDPGRAQEHLARTRRIVARSLSRPDMKAIVADMDELEKELKRRR